MAARRSAGRSEPAAAPRARDILPEHWLFGDLPEDDAALTFAGLHCIAAGLFLAAGAGATLGRRQARRATDETLRLAPLLAAPLAGAAHVVRAVHAGQATRTLARGLDGAVVGIAAGAAVWSALRALRPEPSRWPRPKRRRPLAALAEAAAPLAFGVTGILGLVLDREEQEEQAVRRRLARRADVVERLVPARRPRLDHIVLHV